MRKTVPLLLLPFLFLACDDDEPSGTWHADLEPDVTMTSMIAYPWKVEDASANNIYYMAGDGHGSVVAAAWAGKFFDVNQDETFDFRFEVKHFYDMIDRGQTYDDFIIYLTGGKTEEFSLADFDKGYLETYTHGDVPDENSFGKTPINFQVDEGGYLTRIDLDHHLARDEEFYVAVRSMIDEKPHYGWFRVETKTNPLTISIKEYALSKVPGKILPIGHLD